MVAHPVKRPPFWVVIAVAFGALTFAMWINRVQVEARQAVNLPHHIEVKKPLQQCAGTDLQVQHIVVEPDTPLLYVLRNDLGLTAAKFGCGTGQCGACTVLVDGRPRPSCRVPAASVQGSEITTL